MHPRDYLSWSSFNTLERSPEQWKEIYIYGKKIPTNRGMAFGKMMATGLENDEATGDDLLDSVMSIIPKFEINDKILEDDKGVEVDYYDREKKETIKVKIPFIKDGKNKIPILCKIDSRKEDCTGFKEDKTAQKRWTKKQVDEFGQITFYATGIYLKTGKIPYDIELVEVPTRTSPDGRIECTGEVYRHPTVRTMSQILNMMVRIKKAWVEINRIMEQELL